jgi:hypothetical protein
VASQQSARTVKRGAREAIIVGALRMRACRP